MQVRKGPNPLVSLAVQLANGQTQAPWPKQSFPEPPQGGVLAARRVCVTHSHFWTKIVTLTHPQLTPSSPPAHPQLTPGPPPPTYDAHLVNRGTQRLRKSVYGCLAVGL